MVSKKENKAFLRIEKGNVVSASDKVVLSQGVVTIGRKDEGRKPTIEILDDFVSRNHIKITFNKGDYILQERKEGTPNGTFINGEKIEGGKSYYLKDGDLIELAKVDGDFQVVFRFRESHKTLKAAESLVIDKDVQSVEKESDVIKIDQDARRVWVAERDVSLRRREFDLLLYLYQNRGNACHRDEIAQKVWADVQGCVSEATIDQTIHRIREKIESDSSKPRYVITLPRYGFRFDG